MIDSRVAIDCGSQIIGSERAVSWIFTLGISRADDLTGVHAAAGIAIEVGQALRALF